MAVIKAPASRPIQYRQAARGAIKAPPPRNTRESVQISGQARRIPTTTAKPQGRTPLKQYEQDIRMMPDRYMATNPGYVSPYEQQRNAQAAAQAAFAQGRAPTAQVMRQYGAYTPAPTMANVRQYSQSQPAYQPRYAPNQQWQYGPRALNQAAYSPMGWRPNPTTLPDTLQGQANRIVDQLSGSLYTDRRWGGEVGDFPYSPEMAYARPPTYKPPYTPPGDDGGGWGWGGGGGGGGYTERPPEWYERMAQWSYGRG